MPTTSRDLGFEIIARHMLEESKSQHTRSFTTTCDPDTAAAVPSDFIDWALAEFCENRWGKVEPHMVTLNHEIISFYFGEDDRRTTVAQALADSIGVFGEQRRVLPNSEMANVIENYGDEHGLAIAQWLHGEYWYGELGEPGSVQVWIDQKAPDGDIHISSPNLGRQPRK